jgi:hypothetical protein
MKPPSIPRLPNSMPERILLDTPTPPVRPLRSKVLRLVPHSAVPPPLLFLVGHKATSQP